MTVDSAATSSPEPFPEAPGSDARLTRLHEAIKQLRAKSTATVPLASIAPVAEMAPQASSDVLLSTRTAPLAVEAVRAAAPVEAAPALPAAFAAEAAVASVVPVPLPLLPIKDGPNPSHAAATIASHSGSPRLAAAEPKEPEPRAFCLENWFSPASLRQYRQLAGNIASQLSVEPAALGVAALSCRHGAEQLAARLAMCLAERQEGEVLLVEPAGPRLALAGDAHNAGLVDVVAGRANWADAISSTEMKGLHLLGFGSAAAPEDASLNDQWRTALVDLKRRYRYIVSAARPGESFSSDAWLAAIDGVYLAVSLADAPRRLVVACQSQLNRLGARVLGCIALN